MNVTESLRYKLEMGGRGVFRRKEGSHERCFMGSV